MKTFIQKNKMLFSIIACVPGAAIAHLIMGIADYPSSTIIMVQLPLLFIQLSSLGLLMCYRIV